MPKCLVVYFSQGGTTARVAESIATGLWGRDCLLCLYCEMDCPEEAISSPISWLLFAAFVKHNVRAASNNPAIDRVQVKHGQGQTTQIRARQQILGRER